jgi:hypothetical protein
MTKQNPRENQNELEQEPTRAKVDPNKKQSKNQKDLEREERKAPQKY